jgi:hypothetical protein
MLWLEIDELVSGTLAVGAKIYIPWGPSIAHLKGLVMTGRVGDS